MHTDFTLPLAYTRWSPSPGEPFTEASFTRRTIAKTFGTAQVALVLVDVWNLGWGPAPLVPRLREAVQVITGLWRDEAFSFNGQ